MPEGNRRRDLLAVLVLTALLAGAVVVLLGGLREEPGPPPPEVPPGAAPERRSAARFLDSVGVNVHVSYLDTSYARIDDWLPRLRALGVRHVRDGLEPANPTATARLQRLAREDLRLTLITSVERAPEGQVAFATDSFGRAVEAIEAPNEIDSAGPRDWPQRLRRFLPALRRAVRREGDAAPALIGPSFIQLAAFDVVRPLSGNWEVDNLHPYPGGNEPASNLDEQLAIARRMGAGRLVQATETGYHNALEAESGQPPVSEAAVADYVPRLALAYFAAGIERSFLYELADEKPDPGRRQPDQHFGLLRQNLTPKPAYGALRNLLRVVRAAHSEGRRRDTRVEAPRGVRSLLLERSGGGSVLALWRDEPVWDLGKRSAREVRPVAAQVFFQARAQNVTVHRPSRGERAVQRHAETASVRVPVSGDVVLVSYR